MSDTVRNDSLDNFETNRDQEIGKAIADAASALSKNIQNRDSSTATSMIQSMRSKLAPNTTSTEKS